MVSDWALRGIHRRDTRNEKIEDIRPPARHGKKRNTKKWCRGVEGREHQNEWFVEDYWFSKVHRLKCVKCGKVLKMNFLHKSWGYHGPG